MNRTHISNRRSWFILLGGVCLALFGLLVIFDASVIDAYKTFGDKFHYVKQQSIWLVIGIVSALLVSQLPVSWLKKRANLFYAITLCLMVAVLIPGIGSKFLGARRWIIAGPIVIQPSELLKISFALYLSAWLESDRHIKQFLGLVGLNVILIMLQPDLGTAIIVIGVSFLTYYLSGARLSEIFSFSFILLFAILVLIISSPYRLDRVKTFMDPTSDPLGSSYHISQVLYGLGSGGMSGVGLGKSRQKYAYLPEATTDSIFVIIAEEFGFIGAATLIAVIMWLISSLLKLFTHLTDKFTKILASSITLMFLLQVIVNLGSMVALIPLTGVPLPFISYGGSSLVTNFIALGILMNIAKET